VATLGTLAHAEGLGHAEKLRNDIMHVELRRF